MSLGTVQPSLVGPEGEGLRVDSSADVVAQAAERCGLPQVRFAVGDAPHLHPSDGAYDVVHAQQMLQHLADPVATLREIRRVARPGDWWPCGRPTARP